MTGHERQVYPGYNSPFPKEAPEHPTYPYILCRDEMNLARVEYYMRDFLSIIESRDFKDGKFTSDNDLFSCISRGEDQSWESRNCRMVISIKTRLNCRCRCLMDKI